MLEEARHLGFLGPGPVQAHLRHAAGFAEVIRIVAGGPTGSFSAVDLGSGGGIPGLALAMHFTESRWVLVEAATRRTAFLYSAVVALGLTERITVIAQRAEEIGRLGEHRAQHHLVVARGFGPAAVTAECAAPLLGIDGMAVISEPPGGARWRWPVDGLKILGMGTGPATSAGGASYQVLIQTTLCPDRYPRRTGVPAKRPLF